MTCTDTEKLLDDWLDGTLPAGDAAALEAHAAGCTACRARLARERDLFARLRHLPVPEPDPALFERALATAVTHDLTRRRRRWLGIGGALAASLVIAIGLGTPIPPAPTDVSASVDIALYEEREVRLLVESVEELDSATFTVTLPPGMEIAGYPGQSEISWTGRLRPGKNLLVLPLRAQAGPGGDIVTRVSHTGRDKTFTVRMDVDAVAESGHPSSPATIPAPAPASDAVTM